MSNPAVATARIVPPDPPIPWSAGMPPEVMTDFLVSFARDHFASPATIIDPALRDRVWADDPATPILVESTDHFDSRLIQARPAIYVKDHAWVPVRLGINDQLQGMTRDGATVYATQYNASNTLFCIGGEPKEAKRLATEMVRLLVGFGPLIRCSLNLIRFVVVQRGECAILEESTQNYVVPIPIAYQAGEQWRIEPDAARLRRVVLQVTTRLYGADAPR